MKKWIGVVVAIWLIGAVCGCSGGNDEEGESAVVTRGDLVVGVSVSGNLEMPHRTDLSFGTVGMVLEVLVEEGDAVQKGQVLGELDAQSLELNLESALARQAAAEIDYEVARNQLMATIYPMYTGAYVSDLPGTWLALEEALEDLEQTRQLLDKDGPGEMQAQLEVLEADIVKAKEKLHSTRWALPMSVKLIELQTDQAKLAVQMAELEVAAARLELEKATIVAPFNGVAAEVLIDEGQQLSSMTYANPAVRLIDPSDIEMSGMIDEIDIASVELGQEAEITLDALVGKELKGEVAFISQAGTIQAGVVSYKTTIVLTTPDEDIRDGMSATAEIITDRREGVLLIPNRAIQGSWESPWVEVLAEEGTEERSVTLGMSDGIRTEVLSGLELSEEVVLPAAQLPFSMFGG